MQLILGNIKEMATDAIAIPAHSDLEPSPGIREAVFAAADRGQLLAASRKFGRCRIGHAVVTPSFGLPCKYIIHVAGPGWYSGHKSERILFANCYLRALHKAVAFHCRSIALPLMFSGEYHIPRAQALTIAVQVIKQFEETHTEPEIILVVYKESIYRLARSILDT